MQARTYAEMYRILHLRKLVRRLVYQERLARESWRAVELWKAGKAMINISRDGTTTIDPTQGKGEIPCQS